MIAARAVGADLVVIALKRSFEAECARVRAAIEEITAAGWSRGIQLEIFEGPDEYLYGEESAMRRGRFEVRLCGELRRVCG